MQAKIAASRQIIIAMLFISLMFFILGFVTWLNGSLIPFLKIVCDLNNFQALWVTFAFYIAYTVMALPAAAVMARIGYRKSMTAGLAVMAAGAFLFIPAAKSANYSVFLLALFTLASGMTLMQTAINPYIVCIGARDSAAMRISIMGLFNKGAGIVVPLVFSALILSGVEQYSDSAMQLLDQTARLQLRSELANRLIFPYTFMGLGLLLFTAIIYFSNLPEIAQSDESDQSGASLFSVLAFPQLVLGALSLFAYVGVEVIAGDTIGLYGRQLGLSNYAILTSFTMSAMVLGYVLGVVAIPRFLSQQQALLLSAVLGLVLTLGVTQATPASTALAQFLYGWSGLTLVPDSVLCLALLGLANALVWPAVWPLALAGLGKHTAAGSAFLIMGIAGGAILPMVYGRLADQGSHQAAYWIMLPCYLMIFWYALQGHKIRHWGSSAKLKQVNQA